MTLDEYINQSFDQCEYWFMEECNKPVHVGRIANVWANRDYLMGRHKVLGREDMMYKGKTFITRKTILQYAKTLLTFHNTLLLGKPVSIVCDDEDLQKVVTDVYKIGNYESIDYEIIDRVNKFGDAYEYIYVEDGVIKSKVFNSGDCYPVYGDDGTYLAFIENWTDAWTSIEYWNVYYPDRVEMWNNKGSEMNLVDTKINFTGLPIHYHNINDENEYYGVSVLGDIMPIMDDLEDIMSKMSDAIYTLSLNPMPTAIGQRIESSIPADAMGYILNLDNGSFGYSSATIDYNTIKLYLDNMKNMLNDIACFPSALSGNTNVANVSSVSLQMLFHLAISKAYENEKWLKKGFKERFEVFKKIFAMQGINSDAEISVEFNKNLPVATNEVVENIRTMREIGAMSITTAMEKSGLVSDVAVEKERIEDDPKPVEADSGADKAKEEDDIG